MSNPRFKVGDHIEVWKPGHAEHRAHGIVTEVIQIEEYGGPINRGPYAYKCRQWTWADGQGGFGGFLPDAMVKKHEL